MVCYAETYGAKGNGTSKDTAAVQQAIDACCAAGGGTVVLQSGKTYYCGSIHLKENVEVHLEKGARLKASSALEDYFRPCRSINDPETALIGNPVTGKPSFAFLYGLRADGCTISGEGVIDANGHAFVSRKDKYYVTGSFYPRPTAIYIEDSRHITIRDVTVTDAPFWTLHPAGCDDVLISNIRILNNLDVANSDGIDPDHCSNVRITGCHIECADDCICLKTSQGNAEYGPCENIIISGCTLVSTSAALKIGTEGVGDFRNILVDNCIVSRSNRGISIQVRDGGNVENVSFTNCIIETRRFSPDWWGTAEPIAVTALRRDKNTSCGHIRGIRFFNITAKGENGVLLHGSPEAPIEDVVFDNVRIELTKTTKWPCGMYDLRPCTDYGVEKSANSGFFIRNAKNISIRDSLFFRGTRCPEFHGAINAADTQGLELRGFSSGLENTEEKFHFKNVKLTENTRAD